MRFEQYQFLKDKALEICNKEDLALPDPRLLNPVILAYIGDIVFSMYVRLRLLPTSGHVRIIHEFGAKMVSAVMQAKAMNAIAEDLTEEEAAVAKRGRNTKSHVPKSASMIEYRQGTAFEALLGWLFLSDKYDRLELLLEKSFVVIRDEMQKKK